MGLMDIKLCLFILQIETSVTVPFMDFLANYEHLSTIMFNVL